MTFRNIAIVFFVLLISSTLLFPQVGKIYPVDESHQDSSFYSFYEKLKEIVEKEDITLLKDNLADKLYIPIETGELVSKTGFLKFYKENNYRTLWKNFRSVFSVGGGKFVITGSGNNITKTYYAPYTSVDLINDRDDLMEIGNYSVILGDSVKVYKEKSKESKCLTVLSYDIVENIWENNEMNLSAKWISIKLKNGQKGYVEGKYIRDLFDVKCCFIFQNGKWKVEYIDVFE